ncbi:MAG: hypothetical protein IBX64_02770 [Actinobacteria bacterium]|nr:hypothetical protein [Actinomycetota bacterium]
MREHSRTLVIVILLFVILGLIVNDIAVVAINYWRADKLAQSIAGDIAADFRSSDRNKNTPRAIAEKLCQERQCNLTDFRIDKGVVVIEIETSPKKTLIAQHIEFFKPYLSGKATAKSSLN